MRTVPRLKTLPVCSKTKAQQRLQQPLMWRREVPRRRACHEDAATVKVTARLSRRACHADAATVKVTARLSRRACHEDAATVKVTARLSRRLIVKPMYMFILFLKPAVVCWGRGGGRGVGELKELT
ncbi:unnamed protein product [Lota lota]